MASTLSPMRSKFSADRWPDDPSPDATFLPTDRALKTERPARRRRPLRGLIIFCLGVIAEAIYPA